MSFSSEADHSANILTILPYHLVYPGLWYVEDILLAIDHHLSGYTLICHDHSGQKVEKKLRCGDSNVFMQVNTGSQLPGWAFAYLFSIPRSALLFTI